MDFFVLSLAVAMVVYLIAESHFPPIEAVRTKIVDRNPEGSLAYLANCWWCVSMYVGLGAAVFAHVVLDAIPLHEVWLWWPALAFAGTSLLSLTDRIQDPEG